MPQKKVSRAQYETPTAADVGLGNVDNTSNVTERAAIATLTNKTLSTANNTITGISNNNFSTALGEVGAAWFTWTPTLTNVSGGTLNYSKYTRVGKTIKFRFKYTLAGAGVTGAITFSAPFAIHADYAVNEVLDGTVSLVDAGVARYVSVLTTDGAGSFVLRTSNVAGTYEVAVATSASVPFAWGTGDTIEVHGTYETT